MAIQFSAKEQERFTIVEFEIPGGVCTPAVLSEISPPKVKGSKGVVLSGRGPVWLYARLVHEYHPTAWVATYDPRVEGAVVVESHVSGVNVGDIVGVDPEPQ